MKVYVCSSCNICVGANIDTNMETEMIFAISVRPLYSMASRMKSIFWERGVMVICMI